MAENFTLCSIVTASVLEEFLFLKFSVELFHGRNYTWFVRCDDRSYGKLAEYPDIMCKRFSKDMTERPATESQEFRAICAEK